jgi:N6-L-threonylcarbamoyladenine synthase
MTIILGIESSCDEAAVALVAHGRDVLAEAIASQADDFAAWGGVVPEIAARGHVAALPGLIERVMSEAQVGFDRLSAIAVAAWPGLVGSLTIGVTAAKMIAVRRNLPLIAVDHIQAHLAAVHIGRDEIRYPLVGLVASGGHSHFYLAHAPGRIDLLGGTIDDAAGEAFDKAASVLGLGYPGGPLVDRLAAQGDPKSVDLPRSFIHDDTLRLSFAGLKTALLYHVKGVGGTGTMNLSDQGKADVCAAFQAAIVDCLAAKLVLAAKRHGARALAVGGGVACNRGLRARLAKEADRLRLPLYLPEPKHCADNAAMIAALGHHLHLRGEHAPADLAPLPTGKAGPRKQKQSAVPVPGTP